MVFPILSLSVLCLVFCLVSKIFLNCTSGLVLLCFYLSRRRDFCYEHMTSQPPNLIFCSFVHAISAEVRVTSFFALSGASFLVHSRD